MNDLISRQATIDLIERMKPYHQDVDDIAEMIANMPPSLPNLDEWCTDCKEYDNERHCCPRWNRVIRQTVEDMQAAQPGWTTDVNDILAYLDDVVHPLVSPENWNVYSELYDMVSALPSAQPEEDIRAMCGECDAWNQYKNYPQLGWIPCSVTSPKNGGNYYVTQFRYDVYDPNMTGAYICETDYIWYSALRKRWFTNGNCKVVAWMPLPPKWEGEKP